MNYLESYFFDENDDEIYFICPICNELSCNGDFLTDDYVNVPMIWCDHCNAECVMSKKQFEELDPNNTWRLKSNIKTEDVPENIKEIFKEKVNLENGVFIKVKFVKINRVINRELRIYETDENINQLELQHFINSNFDKKVGEKYGYYRNTFELEFNDYDSFKMGLKIDSFDTSSPNLIDVPFELGFKGDITKNGEKLYSSVIYDKEDINDESVEFKSDFQVLKTKEENIYNRYLDMSHDGINIYLECVDTDGTLFYCYCSGD